MAGSLSLGSGPIGLAGPAGIGVTPPWKTGLDVLPLAFGPATTAQPAAGQAGAVCFLVPAAGGTISVLEFEVTTAQASGLARVVLWNDDGTSYPGTVLYDMADADRIDTGTTGVKTHTPASAIVLPSAAQDYRVWGAVITQGAAVTQPTYRACAGFSPAVNCGRGTTVTAALAWNKTGITGAAPAFTGTTPTSTGTAPLLRLGVQ